MENSTNKLIKSDESDSCSLKAHNDSCAHLPDNNDKSEAIAPIIRQKQQTLSNKIIKVRPVVSVVNNKSLQSIATSKPKIDKIAENLKLLQQQNQVSLTSSSPPKVSLVKVVSSINTQVKNDKLQNQETELKQKATKKLNDEENDDDLTNLNWLNTFSLNIKPLSPPQSPPEVAEITECQNDDEADGGHPVVKNLSSYEKNNIDKLVVNVQKIQPCHSKVTINQNFISQLSSISKNQKSSPKRPSYSFSFLIYLAIESSERKRLSVKDIYSWIIEKFPYYGNVPSGSWKNSVRYQLSYNTKCFSKVDKNLLAMRDFSGKGSLWCINPDNRDKIQQSLAISENNPEKIELFKDFIVGSPQKQISTNSNNNNNNMRPSVVVNRSLLENSNNNNGNKFNLNCNKKRFSIENAKPAILNPKLVNRVRPDITPVMINNNKLSSTSITSLNKNYNTQMINDSTELEAVNALLTMKARSSSMPTIQSSSSTSNSNSNDDSSSNRKGRRKQLFKTPTKRKLSEDSEIQAQNKMMLDIEEYEEDDSYNSFDFFSGDEEDFIDDDGEDEEMQQIYEKNRNNYNNSKKLLIKLPMFNKQSNKLKNEREKEKETDQETNSKNALLELSRAASLIEEKRSNNDQKSSKRLRSDDLNVKNTSNLNSNSIVTRSNKKQ